MKNEKTEKKGFPGWLELHDLSLHKDVEAITPGGAYIRGNVDGQMKFEPLSDILGHVWEKPYETNLTPGWVELNTIKTHRDMEAISPIKPYVHGKFDEKGHFYPDEPFEIIGMAEPDRPSKHETGQKLLWYPKAEIIEPSMKTRGIYQNAYPAGAVVHFTAGRSLAGDSDAVSTIKWGRKQGHAYFVISTTGNVYQAHSLDEWGYHAGKSFWTKLGKGVSGKLLGIEVCCAGKLSKLSDNFFESWFNEIYQSYMVRYSSKKDNIKEGYYHKFTDNQEKALADLILWLKKNNPDVFSFDYVLGHDEVAPNRKNDPGASLSMTMPEFRMHLKNLYENTR